jgi:hypothetical protein
VLWILYSGQLVLGCLKREKLLGYKKDCNASIQWVNFWTLIFVTLRLRSIRYMKDWLSPHFWLLVNYECFWLAHPEQSNCYCSWIKYWLAYYSFNCLKSFDLKGAAPSWTVAEKMFSDQNWYVWSCINSQHSAICR